MKKQNPYQAQPAHPIAHTPGRRSGPLPMHLRNPQLNQGSPDGYVRALPHTVALPHKTPRETVLYAVIGTWMEEDIISASVKNCLANGCRRVYIVDNASKDRTVENAQQAGAILARTYETPFYDDDIRLRLMNDVTREVTENERLPDVWWLSLDADEFPCGPHGESVLQFVQNLNDNIRCVGAYGADLYPTDLPHYTPDKHPADCQKEGMRRKAGLGAFCEIDHWKHPLLRYIKGDFDMAQTRGSHIPFVRPPLWHPIEGTEYIVLFHAPLRNKETTFARLQMLCTRQSALGGVHRSAADDHRIGGNGAIKRWRCLEHIYAGQWDRVEMPHSQAYGQVTGITLYPWRKLFPDIKSFPRWYAIEAQYTDIEEKGKVELPLV